MSSSTPMGLAQSSRSGGALPEEPHSPSTKLISSDGEFNEAGFKNFLESVELPVHGPVVVAILGQQSSGKSTLMNRLFRTNFTEMKPGQPRGAITKGIWTAEAMGMERLVIAVDVEGTDGREKDQNKTFERRSGLFAAIIADVLIINMNCQNIGLDEGGSRPLLKVIFEAMMRLFCSRESLFCPRKTTLLFVLRNKTEVETPFDMLKRDLIKDIKKIWDTAKPPGHEDTPLSQIFNVEVDALTSLKSAPVIFANEVAGLRSRLFDSIIPRPRHDVEPGSEKISFAGAKTAWEIIKGCKDLDLPPYKDMVAIVRCEEIAKEKMRLFECDTKWLDLKKQAAESSLVPGFCARAKSILDKYLAQYDDECNRYKNVRVSREKRAYLMSEASKVIRPAHMKTLGHGRSDAVQSFETRLRAALREGGGFAESVRTCKELCEHEFDEQCGSDDAIFSSDISTERRELLREIEDHRKLVMAEELRQIEEQHRERLSAKLSRELGLILSNSSDDDIWSRIRSVVRDGSNAAAVALPPAVAEFELDQEKINEMVDDLRQKARELMEMKFREETHDVLELLKKRFVAALIPVASGQEVHQPRMEDAYRKCVKLLSTLAVIRLDEIEGDDHVESLLLSALMPTADQILPDPHPLASDTWEQVPPIMTLITPARCRDIWNEFKAGRERDYADTMRLQEANQWGPWTWIILGLLTLGGCAAFICFIRFTNIDVLAFVVKGISLAATGLGLVVKGMDIVAGLIELWQNIPQAPTLTELFRRQRIILKNIKKALNKLYKRLASLLGKRKAEVAA